MSVRRFFDRATIAVLVVAGVVVLKENAGSPHAAGFIESNLDYEESEQRTPSGRVLDRGLVFDLRQLAAYTSHPDAQVRLLVLNDYSCRWCARLDATLDLVSKRFPGLLSVSHLDFMLDTAALAVRDVHVAARCLIPQGLYLEYHRAAFVHQALVARPGGWRAIARHAGVPDTLGLERCVEHQATAPEVMESTRAALALGYGSTPVLIVGGRQVLGAIDLAELEQIIVSELNKQRVRAPNI